MATQSQVSPRVRTGSADLGAKVVALAGAGLVSMPFSSLTRRDKLMLTALTLCSVAAISPGFHFRPHYFVQILPAVAILTGISVVTLPTFVPQRARVATQTALFILVLATVVSVFYGERRLLFELPATEVIKQSYQTAKPFAESVDVAAFIRENSTPTDTILVIGSEPQIYFYTDRISASGHIYMYPLMEEQPLAVQMQEQMLKQMTAEQPAYLVLVDDPGSWLAVSEKGQAFRKQLNRFVENGYELDGVAAVSRESKSFSVFGERARQFVPDTASRIFVYKLKKGGRG